MLWSLDHFNLFEEWVGSWWFFFVVVCNILMKKRQKLFIVFDLFIELILTFISFPLKLISHLVHFIVDGRHYKVRHTPFIHILLIRLECHLSFIRIFIYSFMNFSLRRSFCIADLINILIIFLLNTNFVWLLLLT